MFGDNNNTTINIVDKYLTWKGADDAGFFVYYDKEKGEEIKYKVEELVVLRKSYSIKGWSDDNQLPIYSNQIDKFDETLVVKSKDSTISKGIYKDIKEEIITAGGKLHILITGLHNGEVIQLALKGTAFFKFNEILSSMNTNNNKIKFKEAEAGKKGAVKYKTAIFEIGGDINEEEKEASIEIVKDIKANKEAYNNNKITIAEKVEVNDFGDKIIPKEEISIEDVPF